MTETSCDRTLRPMLIALGAWAILVVLFTTQVVLVGGLEFAAALNLAFRLWIGWAVFAPLAVWLSLRFPLKRGRFRSSITVHLIACSVAAAASQAIAFQLANSNIPATGRSPGPPPWVTESLRDNGSTGSAIFPGPPFRRRPPTGVQNARIAFDLLIYWSIVSACQALTWSRRARERQRQVLAAEASGTRARLQALQMQLNPHFLFNALNAVTTLVHTNPKAADNMLGDLGELLRASLDSAGEQEITLRRELDYLGRYLEVERTRFEDRLQVVQDIDPETLAAIVPTFILQPLVENAVRHGIEPQTSTGTITLGASRQDDRLRLTIGDSGVGLGGSAPGKRSGGIGLTNTQTRLEELYGDKSSFSIEDAEGGGCLVTIELPFHLTPTTELDDLSS